MEGWIGAVDLAPTILELANVPWEGPHEGRSLVQTSRRCEEPEVPVFFERGRDAAGVITEGFKYILSTDGGSATCKPYLGTDEHFENEIDELYDLSTDPDEQHNVAEKQTEMLARAKTLTCQWVTKSIWFSEDGDQVSTLVRSCHAHLEGS